MIDYAIADRIGRTPRPKKPWKVWLVWAATGTDPKVCEVLPPDLDRLEVSDVPGQRFSFDASRAGVRRPYYSASSRPNRVWRWQRRIGNVTGTSMMIGGGSSDEALAKFKEELRRMYP